jgi:hypothetical protein
MDLIRNFASERLRISQEGDKGSITETQGNEIIADTLRDLVVQEEERQRSGH